MNKTCKKCGASVPADQKFCTSCGGNEFTEAAAVQPTVAPVQPAVAPVAPVAGAQPPKKGMPTWLKVILIILLVLGLMGACTVGCVVMTGKAIVDGANEALEDLESDLGDYDYDYDYDYDDEEEEEDSDLVLDTEYGPGEVFENGSLSLSFDSVNTNFTVYSQYFGPDAGNKVVQYKFTAKNIGSSDLYISSYSFECYSDDVKVDNFSWANDGSSTSGGTISSGKTAYINVYCEVPSTSVKNIVEYDFSWLDENITFVAAE